MKIRNRLKLFQEDPFFQTERLPRNPEFILRKYFNVDKEGHRIRELLQEEKMKLMQAMFRFKYAIHESKRVKMSKKPTKRTICVEKSPMVLFYDRAEDYLANFN